MSMFNKKAIYITGVVILSFIYSVVFPSCGGNEGCNNPEDPACENYNPDLAIIRGLENDKAAAAIKVRNAVNPAKTIPYNIGVVFDETFIEEEVKLSIQAKNIVDSATVFIPLANRFAPFGEYGNPVNMGKLKYESSELVTINKKLQELLAKQRVKAS